MTRTPCLYDEAWPPGTISYEITRASRWDLFRLYLGAFLTGALRFSLVRRR